MEKLSAEQAQTVLYENVYIPAFIEKCASLGLEFKTEDELVLALENAALVKAACEEREAAKKPNTTNLMKQANETLRKTLGLVQDTRPSVSPDVQAAISALVG